MDALTVDSLLAAPAPVCWDRLTATNTPLAEAVAADLPDDPLSLALPWLVRHLGVAAAMDADLDEVPDLAGADASPMRSRQAEPGPGRSLPALRRLGFDARLVQCPVARLRAPLLPALLVLRCGDACVLTHIRTAADGQRLLRVVMPGQPPLRFDVPEGEVAQEYTGVALLLRPRVGADGRVAQALRADRSDGHATPLTRLADALHLALQTTDPPQAPWLQRPTAGLAARLRAWLQGWTGGWRQRRAGAGRSAASRR